MAPVFFNRTYDEVFSLLVEARDYLAYREPMERNAIAMGNRLAVNCEAMRVTSRLTQIMAWMLVQKAVHAGEITALDAAEPDRRLSGQSVCGRREEIPVPPGLQSLLDRSYLLYCRVERLDAMVGDAALAYAS